MTNQEPNHTDLAKRFHELTGGCWHEPDWSNVPIEPIQLRYLPCVHCHETRDLYSDTGFHNPTYSNAADILNWMKEKCGEEQYSLFMAQLEYGNNAHIKGIDWSGMIDVAYVENSTALLRKAVGFLEQMKGEGK